MSSPPRRRPAAVLHVAVTFSSYPPHRECGGPRRDLAARPGRATACAKGGTQGRRRRGRQRPPDGVQRGRAAGPAGGRGCHDPAGPRAADAARVHRRGAHPAGAAQGGQHRLAVRSLLPRRSGLPAQGSAAVAAAPAGPGRGDPHRRAAGQRRGVAPGGPLVAAAAAHGAQGELRALVRRHDHPRARPPGGGVPAGSQGLAAADTAGRHRGRPAAVADRRQPGSSAPCSDFSCSATWATGWP